MYMNFLRTGLPGWFAIGGWRMRVPRMSIRSILAAGLLLGGAVVVVPAQANAAEKAHDNCMLNLSTGEHACYSTFREAIAHGTNGQVTNAPFSARTAAADKTLATKLSGPQVAGPGLETSYILSVEYQLSDYSGESYTFFADAPCVEDGQRDFTVNDIRDYDPWWNDRISSFDGFNTCDVNHYENQVVNGGDTTGAKPYMATMGAMDNKTTGLTFG